MKRNNRDIPNYEASAQAARAVRIAAPQSRPLPCINCQQPITPGTAFVTRLDLALPDAMAIPVICGQCLKLNPRFLTTCRQLFEAFTTRRITWRAYSWEACRLVFRAGYGPDPDAQWRTRKDTRISRQRQRLAAGCGPTLARA